MPDPKADDTKNVSEVKEVNKCGILVRKRAVIKRKITLLFNQCDKDGDIKYVHKSVSQLLEEVSVHDEQIIEQMCGDSEGEDLGENVETELCSQAEYHSEINSKLSNLKAKFDIPPDSSKKVESTGTNFDLKYTTPIESY